MLKFKQSHIKNYVKMGAAVDITTAHSPDAIPERFERVGYSEGVNGLNGAIFRGLETGTLYAITARSSALFMFW